MSSTIEVVKIDNIDSLIDFFETLDPDREFAIRNTDITNALRFSALKGEKSKISKFLDAMINSSQILNPGMSRLELERKYSLDVASFAYFSDHPNPDERKFVNLFTAYSNRKYYGPTMLAVGEILESRNIRLIGGLLRNYMPSPLLN